MAEQIQSFDINETAKLIIRRWDDLINELNKIVQKHSDTVRLSFGNDPGKFSEWDNISQHEFLSLNFDETTEAKIIEIYYSAAAREEIKRRQFVANARTKAEREAKKPTQREVLIDAHFQNKGILTNEQVKALAARYGFKLKGMLNNYAEWKQDIQDKFKKQK